MKNYHRYILLLIILVATVLRFYAPFDIPYTYDEFSALFRTHFNTFHELIERGVKVDGHPAGVQVFLFYWTKLFGYKEIVVKLPFIILGILSVWLVYKIFSAWVNQTAGLITAAFVATLQYPVSYSQIARPYISGLFFSMLMVFFWHKVIFQPKQKLYRNGVLYIIAASMCAYNHYFSLLFAIIVGFTGLFFIPKKYVFKYIIFGVLIFITYTPHLSIFIAQIKMGGVENWLGKPHVNFMREYIMYIFHFSIYVFLLVAGIVIFGFTYKKQTITDKKFYFIALAWFVLPFLIGFIYSRYVNAVLQYSVLIFSFPFIFMLLFGHIPELNDKLKLLLVCVILTVNSLTLIFERHYYELLYQSPHKEILVLQDKFKKQYGEDCLSIIDSDKKISRFYKDKLHLDTSYIRYDSFASKINFINFLKTQHKKYLYFGCLSGSDPALVPIIQDYFPYLEMQKDYMIGDAYLFSTQKTTQKPPVFFTQYGFDDQNKNWTGVKAERIKDSVASSGRFSYFMDSTLEWGPTFSTPFRALINNKNNLIESSVKIYPLGKTKGIILVTSLESNGKTVLWHGASLEDYSPQDVLNHWVKIYNVLKLSDIYLNYPNLVFKMYLWNSQKNNFYMDDLEIKTRVGNPVVYGGLQKIN